MLVLARITFLYYFYEADIKRQRSWVVKQKIDFSEEILQSLVATTVAGPPANPFASSESIPTVVEIVDL